MSTTANDFGAKKKVIECANGELVCVGWRGNEKLYGPAETNNGDLLPCDCVICVAQRRNAKLIEEGELRSGYKRYLQTVGVGKKLGDGSVQSSAGNGVA